jgi:chorismate mutase
MENAETNARIKELRERVDEVDRQLIRILNERAGIVQELVATKGEAGKPLFDPRRAEENEGPIYDSSMREIFELILHRIRDLEVQRGEFYR